MDRIVEPPALSAVRSLGTLGGGAAAGSLQEVADLLRVVADRAADLLEKSDIENAAMREASSGVMPDGTPVEDIVADLREERARGAQTNKLLRSIYHAASCKASEASRAIKEIRRLIEVDRNT